MNKLNLILTMIVAVVLLSCKQEKQAKKSKYTSTVEMVTIQGNENIPTFQMGATEVTNEQYKDFLNQAYKEGLITMIPSREKYYTLDEYSDENMVFDKATGNPLIYLGGSRVVKDHNKDGKYEVHEMENPLNRCYIEFNKATNEFQIVDPAKVNWEQYFNPNLYPNVVDSINDWAELNPEQKGRFGYGDKDKKLPTKEEVANWPVTFVRYFGADAFAKFYGYDIPTQTQWQLGARAGKNYDTATNNGEEANATNNVNAWFDANEGSWMRGAPVPATHVQPVKRLAPNAYGLYSMGGNVYEWVSDWYLPDPKMDAHPFTNRTGTQFIDGENGREPITLNDIRIDKSKPLSQNNQYMKTGIGGAHNFPSMMMSVDWLTPHPFLAEANDHFGFRVVSKSDASKEKHQASKTKKRRNISPKLILRLLDENDDDKISLDEAKRAKKAPLAKNFKRLDKNNDGFIDKEELNIFRKVQ